MKKILVSVMLLMIMLSGCSAGKELKVGEQVSEDRIDFNEKIKNSAKINDIHTIFEESEEVNVPNPPEDYADMVLVMIETDKHITSLEAMIWFENDGTALFSYGTFNQDNFHKLSEANVTKLNELLDH